MRYALCRRCHHPASVHDLIHGRRVLILRCWSCPDGSFCGFRRALRDVEEG